MARIHISPAQRRNKRSEFRHPSSEDGFRQAAGEFTSFVTGTLKDTVIVYLFFTIKDDETAAEKFIDAALANLHTATSPNKVSLDRKK
jgi:hypothetical protein